MSETTDSQASMKPIHLTQGALLKIRKLIEERDLHGYFLRVFISRGGCSGFQYGMGLDNQIQEGDIELQFEDLNVVVDTVSLNFLEGAIVDYHEDLMGGGFKIDNPNAISSCGCGNSFSAQGNSEYVPDSPPESCCP